MTGLTSVVQTDPALGGQSAALARMFGLMAPMLILSSGLYALPLSALAGELPRDPPRRRHAGRVPGGCGAGGGGGVVRPGVAVVGAIPAGGRAVPCRAGSAGPAGTAVAGHVGIGAGQLLGGMVLLGLLAAPIVAAWSGAVSAAWAMLPGL